MAYEINDNGKLEAESVIGAIGGVCSVYHPAARKIYWKGDCENVFGYTLQELGDDVDNWKRKIHHLDLPKLKEQTLRSRRDGTVLESEFRFLHKSGKYVWLRGNTKAVSKESDVQIVGITMNIDDRKRKELDSLRAIYRRKDMERKNIANDFINDFSQRLTAAALGLELFKQSNPTMNTKANEQLYKNIDLVNEVVDDLRLATGKLLPSVLYDYGLVVAIEALIKKEQQHHTLKYGFCTNYRNMRFSKEIEINLFRIVQDILDFNQWSFAISYITIQLIVHDKKRLVLSIEDDGGKDGSDVNMLEETGLTSVVNRITSIGGTATVDTGELNLLTIELALDKRDKNS